MLAKQVVINYILFSLCNAFGLDIWQFPKHPRYQAAPRPAYKILVHNSHLYKDLIRKFFIKKIIFRLENEFCHFFATRNISFVAILNRLG